MNSIAKSKGDRPGPRPDSAYRTSFCRRLSRDDEHQLAGLIAGGDCDARNRLVQANVGLVVKIAHDFQGRGLHLDDLVGEGNLGLIRAAEEFEPSFGTRFSTYAAYWIRQSIRHALINTTSTIRLPVHMVGLLTKWRRAEQTLARERGKSPTFEEVASILGLSDGQKMLVNKARQALHFTSDNNVALETAHCAPSESRNRSEARVTTLEADDERRNLLLRMQHLEKRECTILELRYGLEGEGPLTHKEIGRRLGVTREWVRKIEIRALRKLRDDDRDRAIDTRFRRRLPVKRRGESPCQNKPLQSSRRSSVSTLDIPRQTAECNQIWSGPVAGCVPGGR
jgi:RNA polymerase primary sigma factor